MKAILPVTFKTALVICSLGCVGGGAAQPGGDFSAQATKVAAPAAKNAAPKKTMRAFASEQELAAYFKELAEKQKLYARQYEKYELKQATPAAKASGIAGNAYEDSVTNVQHAGVDEGGIVKVHGNHLVVLRRGRLFTVAIGDGALEPISSIDAFGPDIDPRGTWYDEMLVSQDNIAVIDVLINHAVAHNAEGVDFAVRRKLGFGYLGVGRR